MFRHFFVSEGYCNILYTVLITCMYQAIFWSSALSQYCYHVFLVLNVNCICGVSYLIGTSRARVVPMFLLGHFDR